MEKTRNRNFVKIGTAVYSEKKKTKDKFFYVRYLGKTVG